MAAVGSCPPHLQRALPALPRAIQVH
jgi:hypothetical protein